MPTLPSHNAVVLNDSKLQSSDGSLKILKVITAETVTLQIFLLTVKGGQPLI